MKVKHPSMTEKEKSRNSTDTQALVQSMLQRLKLQPGREGQVHLQGPVLEAARGDGDRGEVTSSPVNGTNGLPSKEFSAEIQRQGHVREGDTSLVSSHTQKENSERDLGEKRVSGQDTQAGAGQLFPAKSLQDADISFSGRTDGETVSKDAASTGQSQDKGQAFTPRDYLWSLKPAEGNIDTAGSQEDRVANGGFGSKDLQIVPVNSSLRRKQQQSETKTRRWTQKIKERWRDRQGSFGRKGKEDGQGDNQKSERTGILPQNQLMPAETLIKSSDKAEERIQPALDTSDPNDTTPVHTEDGTNEGYMRSAGDFEFGLGSFSLLDEIVTGQEWAKFLNPNLAAPSANQRPSEEIRIQSHHPNNGNKQWNFMGTDRGPVADVSMAPTSPDVSQLASMDVSAGKQEQHVQSDTDQPEPMEHGNVQSNMQTEGSEQKRRTATFLRPADLLENSALKSRVMLNRKRQHQSAVRLHTDRINDGQTTGTEGSTAPGGQAMKVSPDQSQPSILPLYVQSSSPLPLSPSSSAAPKGVLKHSISQDSECSMEVETKRRRVEENRRVHFAEEVQTIPPPELDLNSSDSEEDDSIAEEDSVSEEQPAAMEEAAPARRAALPAWIRALKRRNTGRKHR